MLQILEPDPLPVLIPPYFYLIRRSVEGAIGADDVDIGSVPYTLKKVWGNIVDGVFKNEEVSESILDRREKEDTGGRQSYSHTSVAEGSEFSFVASDEGAFAHSGLVTHAFKRVRDFEC